MVIMNNKQNLEQARNINMELEHNYQRNRRLVQYGRPILRIIK
jgi:hypothetical protein